MIVSLVLMSNKAHFRYTGIVKRFRTVKKYYTRLNTLSSHQMNPALMKSRTES